MGVGGGGSRRALHPHTHTRARTPPLPLLRHPVFAAASSGLLPFHLARVSLNYPSRFSPKYTLHSWPIGGGILRGGASSSEGPHGGRANQRWRRRRRRLYSENA